MSTVSIARRFCGPPNSGNGGYVCGLLAREVDDGVGAEVTLRRPPPLDRELALHRRDDGVVELCEDGLVLASAVRTAVDVGDVPTAGLAQARLAGERSPFADPARHGLPGCFVCGPARRAGDGLRIFCGPLAATAASAPTTLAAPWTPAADLAGADGKVAAEFVWSALDCPTGFAGASAREHGMTGEEFVLLGRMGARVLACPQPGEACSIVAWATGRDGRKVFASSALRGSDDRLLAVARTTWIIVDREAVIGKA